MPLDGDNNSTTEKNALLLKFYCFTTMFWKLFYLALPKNNDDFKSTHMLAIRVFCQTLSS